MNFNESAELLARYAKTIKKRSWYKDKKTNKIQSRTIRDILEYFNNECFAEDGGIYRNHNYKMTTYQQHWHEYLMEFEYVAFLTIKLPHVHQSGYIRTRHQSDAIKSYKHIIWEFQKTFVGRKHHCERNFFPFKGVLEHGKNDFWHVHIAIIASAEPISMIKRLLDTIDMIKQRFGFFGTVLDLSPVYDKEGLCAYMVKEIKEKDSHIGTNYIKDEGSFIFDLKSFLNVKTNTCCDYRFNPLTALQMWILFAVYLKHNDLLSIPNPINKLKQPYHNRLAIYKRYDGR